MSTDQYDNNHHRCVLSVFELVSALNAVNEVMIRVVIYPLRIEFNVLHGLRLGKQDQLLYDVHLIVGIDGFMELSIIWKTEKIM